MSEKEYITLVAAFTPLGPERIKLLLKYFGSAQKIWESPAQELFKTGLKEEMVKGFIYFRNRFGVNAYFERLKKLKVDYLTIFEKEYPKNLKEVNSAPITLYVKGKIKKEDENAIAVIGSRKMTVYGKEVTSYFSKELAKAKVTIVSGLARGVDTEAHKSALASGGRTIAVLGTGLDNIYPPENKYLAEKISSSGAIISEYPLGYPIRPGNFIIRNRIVSALTKGVLVIEGEERSGTLSTASYAAEQGRSVFAVPGPINSAFSKAPHFLIRNGAKMTTSINDIFEEGVLKIKLRKRQKKSERPLQLDSVARISSLKGVIRKNKK